MRLERANTKAIQYAVRNWHYSRNAPMVQLGYAVFNDAGEWCGVICYGNGANPKIGSPYGLASGQIAELVRVALNGKQESTSKALGLSLKLLRRDAPLVKLVISYADTEQDHVGTIYQATNWIFTGRHKSAPSIIHPVTGKKTHAKSIYTVYGAGQKFEKVEGSEKLKYIYPLSKDMKVLAETLRQKYPKKPATEAQTEERSTTSGEDGGSIPTPALSA